MKTHRALVPRDGLFCKDGRGWHTSASGRGHALPWPWPSTILGAIRSAWGRAEEGRSGQPFGRRDWPARTAAISLGATVAVRRVLHGAWSVEGRTWPVPADALWLEDHPHVHRLDPRPRLVPTLGSDDDPAWEALWTPVVEDAAKPLHPPRWWTDDNMTAWLCGADVPARSRDDAPSPTTRVQVHVGLDDEALTADEGVLYSHDVVETLDRHEEWGVAVEADLPDGAEDFEVATLGSDSRLARVESLPAEILHPPAHLLKAFEAGSRGLRLVVATPAYFTEGWLPDGLTRSGSEIRGRLPGLEPEVVLRAALVPRPVHVSGWDMAAGRPKAVARLVPPGAVYHLERADGRVFGVQDARSLWLAALGGRTDEGFGRVLPGTWNPARSAP